MDKDRSRLYNNSIREAYENILKGSSGHLMSTDLGSDKLNLRSDILHRDRMVQEDEVSEFSDEEEGLSDAAGSQDMDGEAENEYTQFKKSLIQDDEWLDDESDTDYTEEADQSFLLDDDEIEDSKSYEYPQSELYYSDERERSVARGSWLPRMGMILVGMLFLWMLKSTVFVETTASFSPDLNKRINVLQGQLNQLIHERDTLKTHYQSDLDQNIKVIIQQFEKNIKRILPKNIKDFSLLYSTVEKLETRVDSLNERVAWKNINDTLSKLNEILPTEIPVIVGEPHGSGQNYSRQVLVIPELHQYLSELLPSLVDNSVDINAILSNSAFKYDLNHYIKEILSNEFQFIERSEFISELQSHLNRIKDDLSNEMELKLSHVQTPQQFSSIVLKKMIHRIYNSNQHQLEHNLNKATFAQGAKMLNHLCSKTLKGTTNPVDLLQDCMYGCSTSTYWMCQRRGCQWAIRFDEPLFLTKISYMHGRFAHNLEVMSAAPKSIAIYVRPLKSLKSEEIQVWGGDSSYIKLGDFQYDLFSNAIKQDFMLPDWFIQAKVLVRSMVFVIEENHGNQEYSAVRKFVVNGVTPKDLQLMSTFPPDWAQMMPEYSVSVEEREKSRLSKVAQWQDHQIPSFGEDEAIE